MVRLVASRMQVEIDLLKFQFQYGAIVACCSDVRNMERKCFDSSMVRLVVQSIIDPKTDSDCFNSSMVRLVADGFELMDGTILVSNSQYGAIVEPKAGNFKS